MGQLLDGETPFLDGHVEQSSLPFLERQYFFFDGISRYESIRNNRLDLPDAMGTIGCLVFDSGVPPWIEMDDVIGSGEVETSSTRPQADQKYGRARWVVPLLTSSCRFVVRPSRYK